MLAACEMSLYYLYNFTMSSNSGMLAIYSTYSYHSALTTYTKKGYTLKTDPSTSHFRATSTAARNQKHTLIEGGLM